MAIQFSVDVGGTFSDLVVRDDESGRTAVAKGPSTPHAPEDGIAALVGSALSSEELGNATMFLHGSTVALNTLLERTGAAVGLITTDGFRDVLELRRGVRRRMLALQWTPPDPLVPRRHRCEVPERILSDGHVDTPLDAASVRTALQSFQEASIDAIAVVLINSYVNPAHEVEVEQLLRDAGFTGRISLSHRIARELREYERTSTTVIDAYVGARVGGYLDRIESALREQGFGGSALVARSGGGVMTFRDAVERPVDTLMSGPAAGAVGSGVIAAESGHASAVAVDVGGTSFDTTLIIEGRPAVKFLGDVDGLPVKTSWIDVRSIGAGGGSLAYVDAGGRLRVGPQSAGADPGPACYARGGKQATVTDAAAHLGMLGFGELAGGLTLDFTAGELALSRTAEQAGLDVDGAAGGIMRITTAAMAGAIRQVTLEKGVDPRELSLVAYGGAGPLFATLLAAELEMTTIIIPRFAGNFSACGLLIQDAVIESSRSIAQQLDEAQAEMIGPASDELFAGLIAGKPPADVKPVHEPSVDLRYIGQEHTLNVPVPPRRTPGAQIVDILRSEFTGQYRRTYGYDLGDTPIELVTIRSTARTVLGGTNTQEPTPVPIHRALPRTRSAYSFHQASWSDFQIVEHDQLDKHTNGPAVIIEGTTTTYLDHGWVAHPRPDGGLTLTREA